MPSGKPGTARFTKYGQYIKPAHDQMREALRLREEEHWPVAWLAPHFGVKKRCIYDWFNIARRERLASEPRVEVAKRIHDEEQEESYEEERHRSDDDLRE